MAVMLLVFFGETAQWFNVIPGVNLTDGLEKLVLSHVAFNISFVSVVVRARLANLDSSMEEAAADLYASRWGAFRRVTLPQIMPGVLGGALLAITLSLDDVVVSSFVSGVGATPVSVYVFGMLRKGVSPLVNAVSVVILAASMALVVASLVLERVTRGLTPLRSIPNTYTDTGVAPTPDTKLDTTTSSNESVMANRAPPSTPGMICGSVTLRKAPHLLAYRSAAASSMEESRLARRARTTTETNEMLNATCDNTNFSSPSVRLTPGITLNHWAVSPKKTSSITAIVTSGMMIGR
jgi:ABC-type molybdate transport system permease subunit